MKRKRPAAPVPVAAEQPVAVETVKDPSLSPLDVAKIVFFSLMLFVSMTLQTGRMAMILVVLALLSFIGKEPFRLMRQRLCLPVLGLLGFMVMAACAAVYSHFGSYAAGEFYKYLAAFSLALILLARFEKKHVPGLLWGFAAVSAFISLLCIDAASSSVLFDRFSRLMEALGGSFADVQQTSETRVAGIYNDANVSASILALGSLVSLHLADREKVLWKRLLACVLLGVSAMGFFLSISRGAILFFALALLVWLIAAGKGKRLALFFLMFLSAVTVVALSIPAISGIRSGSFLPMVLTMVCGPAIFALDWAFGRRVARALEGKGKLIGLVMGILVAACVAYGIAGVMVNGPYTFDEIGLVNRTLDLVPGEYTLSGDWDGEINARILLQDQLDRYHSSGTVLYQGPLEDIAFTVSGEGRVSIQLWGEEGQTIRSLQISDGSEVHLGYPLLPAFVANRLQDSLRDSNSTFMRVQYDKDAWTLFLQSPLIGHGLGSTEGLYTSVQSFFYESKYVHNHVLQIMSDMGLVGLIAFLALLGGALWLLLKNLRSETGSLAAMMLACWVMMNGHSLMEINFSVRGYLCAALCLLMVPILLYAESLKIKAAQAGSIVLTALLWGTLVVSGCLMEGHRIALRESQMILTDSVSGFMNTTKKLISKDKLDHEQNQLNYVGNAVRLNDSRYNGYMRKYVEELRASGTYTACSGLARYYYLPRGEFEELFACSREGIAQEASSADAWNLQLNFYRNDVLSAAGVEHMDEFMDGVLALQGYLAEYSQDRMEDIKLTEENQTFLNALSSVRDAGMKRNDAWVYLTEIMGYGQSE